jgi:hypothetical protein
MRSSQEAVDYCVRQEVTSPAYYTKHYQNPEWPGASSGITVACGYDLGYASPEKIRRDWSGLVSAEMLDVMLHCSGVKGQEAKALLPQVRSKISIPWAAAVQVFMDSDWPQWESTVAHAIPNTERLTPTCYGVLTATAYNRGAAGFNSNAARFTEMHNIRNEVDQGDLPPVAGQFLSMRRLWPTLKGLQDRYTEAASLWNKGLTQPTPIVVAPPVPHDGEHPLNAGPARTKPPATTNAQNGATTAVVVATGGMAKKAAESGMPLWQVALMVVAGLVVAGTIWYAWYRNRNPK